MKRLEEIREKAEFYFDKKTKVHIKTVNGRYYGGLIMEFSDKFIVVNDYYFGDIFLYFHEIVSLERFNDKNEVGVNGRG